MKINKNKTQAMMFSFSRKLDFPPEILFIDGTLVETMSTTSLLGVIVSDDLKWKKNTKHICAKAKQRLWMLRRLL